jgi:hypothetical protein
MELAAIACAVLCQAQEDRMSRGRLKKALGTGSSDFVNDPELQQAV